MSLESTLASAAIGLAIGLSPVPVIWFRHHLWKRQKRRELDRLFASFEQGNGESIKAGRGPGSGGSPPGGA